MKNKQKKKVQRVVEKINAFQSSSYSQGASKPICLVCEYLKAKSLRDKAIFVKRQFIGGINSGQAKVFWGIFLISVLITSAGDLSQAGCVMVLFAIGLAAKDKWFDLMAADIHRVYSIPNELKALQSDLHDIAPLLPGNGKQLVEQFGEIASNSYQLAEGEPEESLEKLSRIRGVGGSYILELVTAFVGTAIWGFDVVALVVFGVIFVFGFIALSPVGLEFLERFTKNKSQ